MSSSLVDRITAVLREHRWASIPATPWGAGKYICMGCEVVSVTLVIHDAHVAAAVEAELQLTEETRRWKPCRGAHRKTDQRRWVSAWSEVQP